MTEKEVWHYIESRLQSHQPVILLWVLESIGSSPGRQGFKMALGSEMVGSIGGGMMEHKLIELAKSILHDTRKPPFIIRQIHQANEAHDRSGMICSGEQTVAFCILKAGDLSLVSTIVQVLENNRSIAVSISNTGLSSGDTNFVFNKTSEEIWNYSELIGRKPHLHIFGGGHVALAFSRLMKELNFIIHVYDNRDNLNTMEQNSFAHHKRIIDYSRIRDEVEIAPEDWVVLMTFGYRTDGQVLRQLLGRNYRFLGVLGSKSKIETMWKELLDEGVSDSELAAIHAPVGLSINSQTPAEIAVSIAAEIISEKNRVEKITAHN